MEKTPFLYFYIFYIFIYFTYLKKVIPQSESVSGITNLDSPYSSALESFRMIGRPLPYDMSKSESLSIVSCRFSSPIWLRSLVWVPSPGVPAGVVSLPWTILGFCSQACNLALLTGLGSYMELF